jgi:hypothetical protein
VGNNYYSFRIIIRINKNKKKEKTSNTSSREFRQNPHNTRTQVGTLKKTPPPLVGSELQNLFVFEQKVNKNQEPIHLSPHHASE